LGASEKPVSMNEPASDATPSSRRRLILTTAFRLIAAGIVVAGGIWTVVRLRGVLHDPAPVAVVESNDSAGTNQPQPAVFDTLAAAVTGGRWEFVDGKRTLSFGTLGPADLATFWDRPLPTIAPRGERDSLENTVLDLIPRLQLTGRKDGERYVYRWDLPTVKAQFVTTASAATARLISGRAAIFVDSDRWATLESNPFDDSSGAASPVARSTRLVDYPPGTELLAVRYGPSEHAVGEFSQAPGRINGLAQFWRSAGCDVALQETPEKPDFREGFCRRGGRLLRVVMWEPPQGGVTVLVLGPATAADIPATR